MRNGFSFVLGGKASIEHITPRALDSIFLCVLLGDELVLVPLFSPIASNPLDSSLALIVILFKIYLVNCKEICGKSLAISPRRCLPPFLADFSVAIRFKLKGFKTVNGFRLLVRQELASGELI